MVVRYALSDRRFIKKGWTKMPVEKLVRKVNIFRMVRSNPQYDWFAKNKHTKTLFYDTGEKLAEIDVDGYGRWYYRNGGLALAYYNDEDNKILHRYVVHSAEGCTLGRNIPVRILATFDQLGNAIIYDHSGKVRLEYDQSEGIVYDKLIGPPGRWKWHTLNDPPTIRRVFVDNRIEDPCVAQLKRFSEDRKNLGYTKEENETMLALEFNNYVKQKRNLSTRESKVIHIRMKALKINEYFSLKIIDQANVLLLFRDRRSSMRLNIGLVLIKNQIIGQGMKDVKEQLKNTSVASSPSASSSSSSSY